MNNILFNGMAVPQQAAAPEGTAEYIEGAPEKWIEMDVEGANALLDGIEMISTERNADGFRTFVDGENAGKAITLEIETCADAAMQSQAVALLGQYYREIGIQVVEVSNTDNNKRNEKYYAGDVAMASLEGGTGVFNIMIRPDYLAANRNNVCWLASTAWSIRTASRPSRARPSRIWWRAHDRTGQGQHHGGASGGRRPDPAEPL